MERIEHRDSPLVHPAELEGLLSPVGGDVAAALGADPVVLVDASGGRPRTGWEPGSVPMVIVGVIGTEDDPPADLNPYDLVLRAGDPMLAAAIDQARRHPLAAAALVVLLRQAEIRPVEDGLAAESAVYSTLQSGPEFAAWRRGRTVTPLTPDEDHAVLVERTDDRLRIMLNRPSRHNAVTAGLRDALTAALAVGLADDSITHIELTGNGPSFCSGGDLDEFGTFPDPATAHVTRLTRSPARLVHQMADRVRVELHGACMGAGIELAAFARHVVAAPGTVIALPELQLGLVPGAGGTVSIPRRVGRHRAAALALSGLRIDAPTALSWGLIDAIA